MIELGKIGKMGFGNLGSGILGNHKKGGISSIPPPDGVARMRRKDAGSRRRGGGEDKDAQKKAGVRCCWA